MKRLPSIISFVVAPAITSLLIAPICYFYFKWFFETALSFSPKDLIGWLVITSFFAYLGMCFFGLPWILYLKARHKNSLTDYLKHGVLAGFSAALLFGLLFLPLAPVIFFASVLCSCLYWLIENALIKKADQQTRFLNTF